MIACEIEKITKILCKTRKISWDRWWKFYPMSNSELRNTSLKIVRTKEVKSWVRYFFLIA